jgi:hypothetical protein
MVQKQKSKTAAKKRTGSEEAKSQLVCKKDVNEKNQNEVLLKASQPKSTQLDNYREFLRYLLSGDIDSELPDET